MHWFLDPILNHYADFNGRATRQQFWMFVLYCVIVFILAGFALGALAVTADAEELEFAFNLASLAILLPSFAISVRRLHDINMSGWWVLIGFIPLIGPIILLIFHVRKGDEGLNNYGALSDDPAPVAGSGAVPKPPAPPVSPASSATSEPPRSDRSRSDTM